MITPRSTHRGYALIEMVLAIGAVAIVLGLCGGLLHVLLRLDRTGRAHLVETATIGRLARQFRNDVHAAREAKAGGDGGAAANLDLALPEDRKIVYEAHDRALVRTEHHGVIVARRETYTLPFCRDGRFLVRPTNGQVWVSLELRRRTANENETSPRSLRHDLQIEALAGKDQSHLSLRVTATEETER
jgi:hypothetical protein